RGPDAGTQARLLADGGWVAEYAAGPPRMLRMQIAFEPTRRRVLCYGPQPRTSDQYTAERVWEWDGNAWSLPQISDAEGFGAPPARSGHAIAFDVARARLVLYGGARSDLWELQAVLRAPGHVFHVRTSTAKMPANAEPLALAFTAVAGGDSQFFTADVPGTKMDVFSGGAW